MSLKEIVELVVPEDTRERVCNDVSIGTDLVVVASFYFFSSWSLRNTTLIFRILIEVVGTNSTSLLASLVTLDLLHNSVISIGKKRDVRFCIARICICEAIIFPRFCSSLLYDAPKIDCLA